MLIKGTDLTASQRKMVLSAFVHRWTHENAVQSYRGQCPGCAQRNEYGAGEQSHTDIMPDGRTWHDYHVPLTTDDEWLSRHAFDFIKDGSRLSRKASCIEIEESQES